MIELVFYWLTAFLLIYSYFLYPFLLKIRGRNKHNNELTYTQNDELPNITILLAVYNEDAVIEQRIRNIFATNYPLHKIEVIAGSDGSTDNTNTILLNLQKEYPKLNAVIFKSRTGKANVLNQIFKDVKTDFLVYTDAKVLFSPHALFQLIKHFKNNDIGIIGGNIVNKKYSTDGISVPEKTFMSGEMQIKYYEGVLWRCTMGVYGACYAIRKNIVAAFPEGLTVDDFYMNMHVLQKSKQAIMELNALCFEEVPNNPEVEFKRKVRISVGNFQNLNYFKKLAFQFTPISFCFISHKIIRWLGPILLFSVYLSNLYLIGNGNFYFYTLVFQLILITIPLFDFFLHNIRTDIIILRFVTHFYLMNLALFVGLIKYLKGVKSNVWEPTKR
jgi:cellulose synthase/poly-beta-1,6-N-acetylglucosamine synthase-like glycosyltransferase